MRQEIIQNKRRCPDCGFPTTENRCPICMTRIPGSAATVVRTYSEGQKPQSAYSRQQKPYSRSGSRRSSGAPGTALKYVRRVILILFLLSFAINFIEMVFSTLDNDWEYESDDWEYATPESIDDSGLELYNDSGIRVVFQECCMDSFGEAEFCFYLENNTDQELLVYSVGSLINGEEASGLLWQEVSANGCATDTMRLELAEVGLDDISDIKEMTLTIQVDDPQTWELLACSDPITFTPYF